MRIILATMALALLVGCGPSKDDLQEQIDEAESQISELTDELAAETAKIEDASEKLGDAQQQLATLQSAISNLDDESSRFKHDSWRSVVPGVQSGTDDVDASAAELSSRLDDIGTALEQ